MGDIADRMLEGDLCQGCGEYMGAGDGFPVFCSSCEPAPKVAQQDKCPCAVCGKRVKFAGLKDHMRVVHGDFQ